MLLLKRRIVLSCWRSSNLKLLLLLLLLAVSVSERLPLVRSRPMPLVMKLHRRKPSARVQQYLMRMLRILPLHQSHLLPTRPPYLPRNNNSRNHKRRHMTTRSTMTMSTITKKHRTMHTRTHTER